MSHDCHTEGKSPKGRTLGALISLEPITGFEPATYSLRMNYMKVKGLVATCANINECSISKDY